MKKIVTLTTLIFATSAFLAAFAPAAGAAPTTLCKAGENPCAAANRYPAGTTLEATASKLEIANFTTFTCETATAKLKTKSDLGSPLTAELTSFPLSGCKAPAYGSCSVETIIPSPSELTINYLGKNNGTLGGNGVSWKFTCMPGGVLTQLTFKAEGLGTEVKGGKPATFAYNEMPITCTGACTEKGSLTAQFTIKSPEAVYVEGGIAPTVTSESATGIGLEGGTINGTINPNYGTTKYHFEYGTTTGYGTSVPVPDKAIGNGGANVKVSQPLSGLLPGTTYHYRLVATNEVGTSPGLDKTFTTRGFTTLCKVSEGGFCAAKDRYPAGTAVEAKLQGEELLYIHSSLPTIKCSESTLSAITSAEKGDPLPLSPSGWTLGHCGTNTAMSNCTVTNAGTLKGGSLLWGEGANGALSLGTESPQKWYFQCSLIGVKVGCIFTLTPEATVEGGNPAHLAVTDDLTKAGEVVGGFGYVCPENAMLEADYALTAPNPAFVAWTN